MPVVLEQKCKLYSGRVQYHVKCATIYLYCWSGVIPPRGGKKMDLFLSILKSVIYGVIEGITEWLPISSTGHMILAEQVLKFGYTEDFMEMFRVVIQLGAILAVVVLYFHKLWPFCKDNGRDTGFAAHLRWPVVRLWFKIIAACVPAAVLGILLDDWMDAHLYNSKSGLPKSGFIHCSLSVESSGTT